MAAENTGKWRRFDSLESESGQSMIEFLIVLPLLVGLVGLLLRVNMAIQVSIVNQKYARAQALWLAFNSPVYPELGKRVDRNTGEFLPTNQMILGVSQNTAPADEDLTYVPEPPEQPIAREPAGAPAGAGTDTDGGPTAIVKIRNTVTLCTQSNVMNADGELRGIGPDSLVEGMSSSAFEYCRGNL